MIQVTLRFKDGIGSSRPWLRPLVEKVQRALKLAGQSLGADGQFGKGTLKALKAFQRSMNLPESGQVAKGSWQALKPQFQKLFGPVLALIGELMPTFRGDLDWVHAQEGHLGKPYWPGGESGVTLDPGVDLGHADSKMVERVYRERLGESAWQMLQPVFGVKGEAARLALKERPELATIKIDKHMAHEVMPLVAKPYWDAITKRFPGISTKCAPASVQTVLLSLAYNRGPGNRHLKSLDDPINRSDWDLVADKVARMQQRHKLMGIRRRRRLEGNLIRSELKG